MNTTAHFSSARDDWETPPALFAEWHARFGFTVDVCATAANAKCPRFFSPASDGLAQSWRGEVCWMNPPYGRQIGKWVAKAQAEARAGATVVGLLPARTDTRWFHDHILGCAEIHFLRGRVRFSGGKTGAPFPSMIVVWTADETLAESIARQQADPEKGGLAAVGDD